MRNLLLKNDGTRAITHFNNDLPLIPNQPTEFTVTCSANTVFTEAQYGAASSAVPFSEAVIVQAAIKVSAELPGFRAWEVYI